MAAFDVVIGRPAGQDIVERRAEQEHIGGIAHLRQIRPGDLRRQEGDGAGADSAAGRLARRRHHRTRYRGSSTLCHSVSACPCSPSAHSAATSAARASAKS